MLTNATSQKLKGHFVTKDDLLTFAPDLKKTLYRKNVIKYFGERSFSEVQIIFILKIIVSSIFKKNWNTQPPDLTAFFYAVCIFRKYRRTYLTKEELINIEKESFALKVSAGRKRNIKEKLESIIDEVMSLKESYSWKEVRLLTLKKHHTMFNGLKCDDVYFRKLCTRIAKEKGIA